VRIGAHPFSKPRWRMSARRIVTLRGQGGHETLGKSVKNPLPQGRVARRTGFDQQWGPAGGRAQPAGPYCKLQVEPLPGQEGHEPPLNREEVGQWERNSGRGRFACGAPPSPGVLPFPGRPHRHLYESSSGRNLRFALAPSPGRLTLAANSSALDLTADLPTRRSVRSDPAPRNPRRPLAVRSDSEISSAPGSLSAWVPPGRPGPAWAGPTGSACRSKRSQLFSQPRVGWCRLASRRTSLKARG
jgi:hypothetical protein